MPQLRSSFVANATSSQQRQQAMAASLQQIRALEQRASAASNNAKPLFEKRGQLLPRERLGLLLDVGAPFLELSSLAGYGLDKSDLDRSIPGAGMICGIGFVSGTRVMVNVSDSGIDAGAIQSMGLEKALRAQQIALENKLPYLQLIESAGANLMKYKVEDFVAGGQLFYNLARLSAAGLPVIAVVHGSSTAGGAYMPGLSDYVVMVKGRAKAFLAGPPLLKAATGEIASDEDLGGAQMHGTVSGLAEYLAEDDAHAVSIAREIVAKLQWNGAHQKQYLLNTIPFEEPLFSASELAGLMPTQARDSIDMREIIARLVDGSDFLEMQPDYGITTVCGHASIYGIAVGIITNNGPIDPAGSHKVTHFIQACCQANIALLYLQNTTGYIVGTASERAGMIKHGSKMIQAVSNANVPSITIHCGASFGAGNYGMCGRAFGPRFVFSWPNAKTAVMGGEQAATTMRIVTEATAKRKGEPVDEEKLQALEQAIIHNFNAQAGALYTSARMLDDGIIDPADTRKVLAIVLQTVFESQHRHVHPIQFGVSRP
jgi:geranyl-CoA carboxylase beta subunit